MEEGLQRLVGICLATVPAPPSSNPGLDYVAQPKAEAERSWQEVTLKLPPTTWQQMQQVLGEAWKMSSVGCRGTSKLSSPSPASSLPSSLKAIPPSAPIIPTACMPSPAPASQRIASFEVATLRRTPFTTIGCQQSENCKSGWPRQSTPFSAPSRPQTLPRSLYRHPSPSPTTMTIQTDIILDPPHRPRKPGRRHRANKTRSRRTECENGQGPVASRLVTVASKRISSPSNTQRVVMSDRCDPDSSSARPVAVRPQRERGLTVPCPGRVAGMRSRTHRMQAPGTGITGGKPLKSEQSTKGAQMSTSEAF